jgi:hypothetical protein
MIQNNRREKTLKMDVFPALSHTGFAQIIEYDNMDTLRKGEDVSEILLAPEEEQRPLLRSSKGDSRCSSFGINNSICSEEMEMDQLAKILVEIFLDLKNHEQ